MAGETLTVADVHLVSTLTLAFRVAFSEDQRKPLKNLVEYFLRVANEPAFVRHWGRPHLTTKEWEVPAATAE